MQWIGLITEVLFLGLGVYLYLFAVGGIKFKNPQFAQRAEKFRQENRSWLRIAALGLMAIMFVNVFLSLAAIF
jgi:ABC-type nickel/cobalt efflux system permease component RcnA